jgi:hypothetical protein
MSSFFGEIKDFIKSKTDVIKDKVNKLKLNLGRGNF